MNNKADLPKTITETVYLTARPASWEKCGYAFSLVSFESKDYIYLGSVEVTMDVPQGYDLTNAHIDILKAEKSSIQAEAHIKANNIEDQIQRLLAIEYKEQSNEDS